LDRKLSLKERLKNSSGSGVNLNLQKLDAVFQPRVSKTSQTKRKVTEGHFIVIVVISHNFIDWFNKLT
jgi:hypothetical protein